ncbi:MAG: sarcosine oxidase subunit delta [Pseudomonadota bacterium]
MIRINCPICGLRDETEFTFVGDASVKQPSIDNDDMQAWYEYVFLRDNPRGEHLEYWHHVHGCRQIIQVKRHTVTHEIESAALASEIEA